MVRISKWSWSQGWGRKPEMYQAKCRVAVDFDHDMILRINLKQNRITVTVIKIFEELHNDHMENYFVGPGANVCVKVSSREVWPKKNQNNNNNKRGFGIDEAIRLPR